MPHKYIKPKPELKGEVDPAFKERINRTKRAFKNAGFDYFPDDYITRHKDEVEDESTILQAEYPDCLRKRLVSFTRVALPSANMFEFQDGTLDSNYKVKSCLVYGVQVEILNEEALRKHNVKVLIDHRAAQNIFIIGRIQSPVTGPDYYDGELKGYRIIDFNNVYFVEDTPQNIKDILEKYGRPGRQKFAVAIAAPRGMTFYENSCVYSVYNDEDFIAPGVAAKDRGQQILNLVEANIKGFLAPNERNGVERYLLTKKKLTDKGLIASEIDQLNIEDLRNMIAVKKQEREQKGREHNEVRRKTKV